uniref:D7-related protein n=1 Tax=Culicoides sonorensis TaxID=179676 RepID=Q66UB3_CULSO|nr:D7-related protein [Culicoides sonorensis]
MSGNLRLLSALLLLNLIALSLAGTRGTSRCEKRNKLDRATIQKYRNWQIPTKFKNNNEKCHLHCVFKQIGWMRGHYIMDAQIGNDIDAKKEFTQKTPHLRTLLFEDCNINERSLTDKCGKAIQLYTCLVQKFKPTYTIRAAFDYANEQSEE